MDAHLYLSPHLDDAVISCGGLMAMQDARGEPVSVLTIFAGDPPHFSISPLAAELHARWGKVGPPIGMRRAEDRLACGRLGASVAHLQFPDAIYRMDSQGRPLYPRDEALFSHPGPEEETLIQQVADSLREIGVEQARVYCPLAVGGHVDHRITRLAAERLGVVMAYYHDLPYASRGESVPPEMGEPRGRLERAVLSEEAIKAWAQAVAEYGSQISTFWENLDQIYEELRDFHDAHEGLPLLMVTREGSGASGNPA